MGGFEGFRVDDDKKLKGSDFDARKVGDFKRLKL